jgi:hypothetical protein
MTWAFDGGDHVRPMEADIHARLWERNNQSILKYCGFRYDDETHVFRLYTEYARFGTLRKLMDKYATNDTKVGAWNVRASLTRERNSANMI